MLATRAVFCLQRSPWHLGNPGARQVFWISIQSTSTWGHSCLSTFGSTVGPVQCSLSSCNWSSKPGDATLNLWKVKALDVLQHMDRHGCVASANIYRSLLKACTYRKDLLQAKQIHAHLTKHGLESTRSLGEYVVSTLVKCGGMRDAVQVFHRLPSRTVFSWTAMISGYTLCGQGREALMMYRLMQEECVEPNAYTFVSLLKACCSIGDVREGKHIHAEAVKHRCESDVFVGSCLVDMYGKLGTIADAWNAFDGLSERNVVCWTAMLGAYAQHGQPEKALQLYDQMQQERVSPDVWTFVSVLQACGRLADKEAENVSHGLPAKLRTLEKGKEIQANAERKGFSSNPFVVNTLISFFGKCGSIEDAKDVFDGLSQRNVVSWNAMLGAYVHQGEAEKALQLFKQMQDAGVRPNDRTLNTLVTIHRRYGNIMDAQVVFDKLSQRDVVSWNIMLAAYADQGEGERTLQLYKQMQDEGVSPNARTFVSVLQACGMCAQKEADVQVIVDGRSTMVHYLEVGKKVHADAYRKGFDSDVFLGSTLISMYGKCGSISNARNVFDGLPWRNVVSWNAMLAAYVEQGQGELAIDLYEHMLEEAVVPDARTIVSALQARSMLAEKEEDSVLGGQWIKVYSSEKGKALHAEAWKKGLESNTFVGNALVGMYAKCGCVADLRYSFERLPQHDVVSWTVMLASYADQGQGEMALHLYKQMLLDGLSPNGWTFVSALQACGILADEEQNLSVDGKSMKMSSLKMVKSIHGAALAQGCASNLYVGSALVSSYGKSGSILDAYNVFDRLLKPDVVSWNAMLTAYVDQGLPEKALQLYEQMWAEGVNPDVWSLVSVVQACGIIADHEEEVCVDGEFLKVKALLKGKAMHAIASIYTSDVFVANSLIGVYGKCGSIVDAQNVFHELSQRDEVTWNAMLAACVEQGKAESALQLYEQMWEAGMILDVRTFVSTIQACGMLAEKEEGVRLDGGCMKFQSLGRVKEMHAEAMKKGFHSNVFVGNTLVSVYGKCGSLVDAQKVFQSLSQRDVVSWNTMLATCVEQGQEKMALVLYEQLLEEGKSPDVRSFVSALQACGKAAERDEDGVGNGHSTKLECLEVGKAIHADVQKKGYGADVFVGSTLVSMYRKCGSIIDARDVFDGLCERNVVSWTVMLGAYVEQGEAVKALQLYEKMQEESVSPNAWTFVYALQACGMLADKEGDAVNEQSTAKVACLEKGKAIHCDIQRKGYESDVSVGSALVTMYGKCGSSGDAQNVFDRLSTGNVALWTAMLAAHVEQGQADKALQLYRQMHQQGTSPDDITTVSILRACTNTGSLAFLRQIHHSLASAGNNLSPILANTLISAYGRCASMVEAQTVFDSVTHPDVVSWNALIAGYARQGDTAASLQCHEQMRQEGVNPNRVTFLSLLSACSHAGLVDKGVVYFESMSRDYGLAPEIEHYVSMVDLLGRAGCFTRVDDLMSRMPMQPNLALWLCLLGACRKHGKIALAEEAFGRAVQLQPKHPAAYVLMSNIYADAGLVELAQKLKQMRERGGAWKKPGQTWIEHEQAVHTFMVDDLQHPQHELLYDLLGKASLTLTKEGYRSSRRKAGISVEPAASNRQPA